jgi:hypothetical protein
MNLNRLVFVVVHTGSGFHLNYLNRDLPLVRLATCSRARAVLQEQGESENFAESMEQENASAISKIRAMFVDPGFSLASLDDAASAVAAEVLPRSDE